MKKMPPMFQISPTHYAATWLLDSRAPIVHPPREVLRYTSEIGGRGVLENGRNNCRGT